MKIAVLLSGGVDSSVALRLLQQQGHDVTAFYLKIWLQDEFSFLGDCPWDEDIAFARGVCEQAGVDLQVLPLQNEYWDKVVSYTITEIKAGRTPNPDMYCNRLIKFGDFYDKIDPVYEKVASGHYGLIEERDGKYLLKMSPDPIKDQTYFLAYVTPPQLERALFPLGYYNKQQIRDFAQEFNLPNQSRKDSQGICFLGKIKFRDFVKFHLGELPGDIIDIDRNIKVGEHPGYYYFTIGQRQGIGLNGGPWYVVRKDHVNNTIYISRNKELLDVKRDSFYVHNINWIAGQAPERENLRVKIRHGARSYACTFKQLSPLDGFVKIEGFDRGIAPGQFAVLYDGEYCLGGGSIEDDAPVA
jgi:tRNA-specific 2-thiouridylase